MGREASLVVPPSFALVADTGLPGPSSSLPGLLVYLVKSSAISFDQADQEDLEDLVDLADLEFGRYPGLLSVAYRQTLPALRESRHALRVRARSSGAMFTADLPPAPTRPGSLSGSGCGYSAPSTLGDNSRVRTACCQCIARARTSQRSRTVPAGCRERPHRPAP